MNLIVLSVWDKMTNQKRPSWDEFWLKMAKVNSERGTCLRRRFGAVIVKDNILVSQGYVGAPRGTPNCTDLGKCLREEEKAPPGQRYELCRSVHAEMNAVINVGREKVEGGTLYLYGENYDGTPRENTQPCMLCWRVIINAGIKEVVVKDSDGIKRLSVEERVRALKEDPFSEFEKSY